MTKSKKDDYFCSSCGFGGNKKELIAHCNKEHKHEPQILFDMIGEFGSLEAANIAYKKLQMDTQIYANRVREQNAKLKFKDDEISRLSKAINVYNEAASGISHTLNLLSTSLEPLREPKENGT